MDKTVSQVPVVKDITSNTVGTVVAPVLTLTDQVENTVVSVPVVGQVVAPVRNVTNSLVPPVVNIVDAVTTPVLNTVDQVTAPALEVVAPVIDPVTGAVKPVVDTVTGGVSDIVDQVVPPVAPGLPGNPGGPGTGVPELPVTGVEPGVNVPGLIGAGESVGPNGSQSDDPTKLVAGVQAAPGSSYVGTLAEYLAMAANASTAGEGLSSSSGTAVPTGGTGYAVCGSDASSSAVGPCAPAVSSSPAPGAPSGAGSGGSGGAGGSAAAHENFADNTSVSLSGSVLRTGNWPLPASLSCDPGSTPD
ncbi:hypothetical protein [Arthrobacter glacialis]|uniref:hypothetical protein n=1 Tax=Arthrobacter glacialis TaxID=1664 RepID=UPI0010573C8D|nr:hypothetical protein [Arthrobacter glacialis]